MKTLLLAVITLLLALPAPAADLIIKGFSLGMPAAKALELLNTNYFKVLGPPKFAFANTNDLTAFLKETSAKITDEKPGRYGEQSREIILDRHYAGRSSIKGNGIEIFLQGGKLNKLELTREAVDRLFRTQDLDAAEFATLFAEAYALPPLTPYTPKSLGAEKGWSRKSLDGWHVQITESKQLTISAIPKGTDRGFN